MGKHSTTTMQGEYEVATVRADKVRATLSDVRRAGGHIVSSSPCIDPATGDDAYRVRVFWRD